MTVSPEKIRLNKDKNTLFITFEGKEYNLSAELLRVESPSAEVQGHGDALKKIVPEKRNVTITALAPVGHYALQIGFSDGHQTGFYTWKYLKELCENKDDVFAQYLKALKEKNLTR